jgi:hypothetical protein
VLTVVGATEYFIYLMSHFYQHCQMIQNYLNVELEMTQKKNITVFFFGEMKKTMNILCCWACVWTGNESQHLQNNN